jgi:hypothetical protein
MCKDLSRIGKAKGEEVITSIATYRDALTCHRNAGKKFVIVEGRWLQKLGAKLSL